MRTLQRESNEDSYWWLNGEAPKNTSRNVGDRRRFKRSCQTLRGVSQEAPVRNANVWTTVLDHYTPSKNRSLVREVQDGRTQTRQYYENPGKNTNCRRKANFQSFHQKGCSRKTKESRTAKAQQEVQKHRRVRVPCQFLLRQPLLCFRAMHRRYRQQLLFHCPLIKRLSSSQIPVSRSANDPAAQHFNNCTVNIQNYFGPQSTNQASSSRVEYQIGEIPRRPSISVRKRRRA